MNPFPSLEDIDVSATRDALHSYARILGDYLKSCRPRRKHWWHASLRPSLSGLTTGLVHAGIDFELELNIRQSTLHGQTSDGANLDVPLTGQPAAEVAMLIRDFLLINGLNPGLVPQPGENSMSSSVPAYSADDANVLSQALNAISATMVEFRAGIPEETSPIQLWPHHFDLSMIWLPGEKIPGQDPANEEYSDKQMNFGFTFGDGGIPQPYLYITAYPLPDALPAIQLPTGTEWKTEPFSGAIVTYDTLQASKDPSGYLLDLWNTVLAAGRKHMLENSN